MEYGWYWKYKLEIYEIKLGTVYVRLNKGFLLKVTKWKRSLNQIKIYKWSKCLGKSRSHELKSQWDRLAKLKKSDSMLKVKKWSKSEK